MSTNEADDWTPLTGWMIVARQLLIRGGIVLAVVLGLLVAAGKVAPWAPMHWAIFSVEFIVLAAVGWPLGAILVRGLSERCGLAGITFLLPVIICLAAAHVAAYHLVIVFQLEAGSFVFAAAGGSAAWSIVAAAKQILTD